MCPGPGPSEAFPLIRLMDSVHTVTSMDSMRAGVTLRPQFQRKFEKRALKLFSHTYLTEVTMIHVCAPWARFQSHGIKTFSSDLYPRGESSQRVHR